MTETKIYDLSKEWQKETIKMNSSSDYSLEFVDGDGNIVNLNELFYQNGLKGSDLTISGEVAYVATATVKADSDFWGNPVGEDTQYTFLLDKYHDDQYPVEGLNGKYMWKAVDSYGQVGGKDRYWLLDNSIFVGATESESGDGYDISETGGANAVNFKIVKLVNGVEVADVTDEYVAAAKEAASKTAYDDSYAKALFNAQGEKDIVTLAGYGSAGDVVVKQNNGTPEAPAYTYYDLTWSNYNVSMAKDKTSYTGNWLNESIVSGLESETYDMGAGNDTISFNGYYGNDTVNVTGGEDDRLQLSFSEPYNKEIVGNDVVLTTNENTTYYATFKVDKATMFDGHLANVKDGKWSKNNTSVYANGVVDISDAFIDASYQKIEGTEIINKAAYDALSDADKALYQFKDGTLRLTIQTGAAHSSNASFEKYRLTTDSLYELEDSWKSTGDYTALTGADRKASTADVKFLFGASDLAAMATEGGTKYAFYNETQYAGLQDAEKHNVWDLHIYQQVGTSPRQDITESYIAAAAAAEDLTAYNKDLLTESMDSTVTLKDFAKKEVDETVMANSEDLNNTTYNVFMAEGQKSYKGTWLNEAIDSRSANESFNMGTSVGLTGKDVINFNGSFGNDTVTVNDGEKLNMVFNDPEMLTFSAKGNDLIIEADVEYIAQALVKAGGSLWGNAIGADTLYTFNVSPYEDSQFPVDDLSGKYLWKAETEYTTLDGKKRYLALDNMDFNPDNKQEDGSYKLTGVGGGATVEGLRIYKVVNGEPVDVTADYVKALGNTTTATSYANYNDSATKALYNPVSDCTVTIKNFVGKATGADLLINGDSIYDSGSDFYDNIKALFVKKAEDATKGKITGGAMNDDIDASDYVAADGTKGLTIDTKSGSDRVIGTNYNDTVKVSSVAGDNTFVREDGGTNKITAGKGNDTVVVGGLSNNTINVGAGTNNVTLDSVGVNKVTAGNDRNIIAATDGYNTVKAGKGANEIALFGGINNVTTGNGDDTVEIYGGNNTIKTSAGVDTINIATWLDEDGDDIYDAGEETANSYNTINAGNGGKIAGVMRGNTITVGADMAGLTTTNNITSGKNDDIITLNGGTNYVNSGAGDDYIAINAGMNNINGGAGDDEYRFSGAFAGSANITDSKGNDTYDFSDGEVGNTVAINDTKGANDFKFDTLKDYYFDVNLTLKKGEAVIDTKTSTSLVTNYKYSSGNDIFFANNDWSDTPTLLSPNTLGNGVLVEGRKQIDEVYNAADNGIYKLDQNIISTIGQAVANWLQTTDFTSTADVLASNDGAAINEMLELYAQTGSQGYIG